MANTTQNLGRVGVIYGGVSAEREVSLNSGAGVHAALLEKGVDAHLFDLGKHSLAELEAQKFDRVFIICMVVTVRMVAFRVRWRLWVCLIRVLG